MLLYHEISKNNTSHLSYYPLFKGRLDNKYLTSDQFSINYQDNSGVKMSYFTLTFYIFHN